MTQLHRLAATALVLALTASACGTDDGAEPESSPVREKISVSGDFGTRPTVEVDAPLKLSESSSWVTEKGEGDEVGATATTILSLTLANGRTGKTAISTADEGQRPLEIPLGDTVFPSLNKALVGQSADSRVVVASTAEDSYGANGSPQIGIKSGDPVVMVADILSTDPTEVLDGPTGATVAPPAGVPTLVEKDGVPTGFDLTGLKKSKKFRAVVLREGTGPAIEAPDRVAVNYLGQVWGAKKIFEESYTQEPAKFSVGLGSVIKAWDRGLVGLKEGSRVMLICPPGLAYGKAGQGAIPANSTLVFVIDVLGVG